MSELLDPIHQVLSSCGLQADDVSKAILCGGTAKIPKVQKAVAGILKKAEVLSTLSPDEVLALGAATQASLLEEKWDSRDAETSPKVPGRQGTDSDHAVMSWELKKASNFFKVFFPVYMHIIPTAFQVKLG